MKNTIDIVILSNGPGEITTWVYPVIQALRKQLQNKFFQVRISLILSPCPNATGNEVNIASYYPEIDRIQGAEYFWQFLLFGKTAANWDWYQKGVVLFLGGDQFFTLVISKKLGYRSVIYAEWEARWWRYIDRFGVMKSEILDDIPQPYQAKLEVIGDLMADVTLSSSSAIVSEDIIIGLLPGSKAIKLAQGMALTLAISEYLHQKRPEIRLVIPVAPTLDLQTLAKFADCESNPIIAQFGGISGKLHLGNPAYLETQNGVKIELYTQFPAYDLLSKCQICLTTVGANTAQLGALAVPMIVLLPTQQLDAMRSWDGIPGILANLPGLGAIFAKIINRLVLKQGKLFAWPNIRAKQEIVPELVGELQPEDIGNLVLNYLDHPEQLEAMRQRLRQVRGKPGAAQKLANIVIKECLKITT
ncbi:lipid-A-disaccharide synthase [Planktothrix agardhii]|jgi:lipid-A-disaccharide synthase|uniref:lipid-A-disaccharide synthase n=1 Tax=Planktothrix agardhii TaxID=1160 RepID=UPI0020A795FE|nr:lipid-A-disaccharide synthase [Planktothrix agardhii]CAD5952078.1 Lipid A disaccharide synthetase [Planktothrix agardhii]